MRTSTFGFVALLVMGLVLCAPAASWPGGLSDDTLPTETACDPGDVFVPDPAGLLWAADDGDGLFGCGTGTPVPVCNINLPDDLNCDLDAVTFDVLAHPQVPPPISISLDDGDPSPNGPPQTSAFELFNVLPPVPPGAALLESGLLLLTNPSPEASDDDVDAYETNMVAAMLPHPSGYFFDFSTDADNPCGLDPGDIYFAQCPGFTLFCDDVTQIGIPDDCDVDALHLIDPTSPFPAGNPPGAPSQAWGYLFSIDAASGPACLGLLDPADIYYTECSANPLLFPGYALWADDVAHLGMTGCDNIGAGTQNSSNYCDIDAISVVEVTTTTSTTSTTTSTTSTTVPPTTSTTASSTSTTSTATTTPTSSTTTTTLAPLCAATPETGCRLAEAGKAQLQLKDRTPDTKDQLKWKWKKGAATDLGDFADPVTGSADYRFCIYDSSASSQPLAELALVPGGTCDGKPCWKTLGSPASPKGYKYKNKAGTPSGIIKVKFKAGVDGKAQVQLKAKGDLIPMPALPLTLNVTAQLLIDDGATTECWQTVYSSTLKNDAAQFKAKGP
jgi:hypothetical protein